jgi:Uma2 family endonuclease
VEPIWYHQETHVHVPRWIEEPTAMSPESATAAPTSEPAIRDVASREMPEFPMVSSDVLYEVVDGRILEKPVGAQEVDIATILVQILGAFARSNRLGRVFSELVFLIDPKKNRQRRPDVSFVSDARWPYRRRLPRVAVLEVIPDLAIEVVSPSNSAYEVQEKIQDYFAAGVTEVWIIYPEQRQLQRLTSPTRIEVIQAGEDLEGGPLLPGFRMRLAELFEDDPE